MFAKFLKLFKLPKLLNLNTNTTKKERLITELTAEMRDAAKALEFEKAAYIRDRIKELRNG